MGADLGFVEGVDAQTQVIHVAGPGPWRGAAFLAQFAADIDKIDERASGPKLNQAQIVLAALHRASQDVLVKPDHAFHVNNTKNHMIDALYGEGHHLTP